MDLFVKSIFGYPGWTGRFVMPDEIGDMYELKTPYRIKQLKEDIERKRLLIDTYKTNITYYTNQITEEEKNILEMEKKVKELEKSQ